MEGPGSRGRCVAYLGNFSVPFSTESHVAASLETLGHKVCRIQEGTPWNEVIAQATPPSFSADMFLWTQTYSLAPQTGTIEQRLTMLNSFREKSIPTVGFHLDRWWGLDRENQIAEEPFFRVDYLFTADGGHDDEWTRLGINHYWLPPGVYHAEAVDGTPRRAYATDVVFVGSWRHYGHEEWWPTRQALLQALAKNFKSRVKFFPIRRAIRGMELTNLYASCKVAVGDSCLAGAPAKYWSDRVPETTGRGAVLVHPHVEGIHDIHPGLPTFESGNVDQMLEIVRHLLAHPTDREELRQTLATYTRENNTYLNRLREVLRIVLGD